MSTKKEVKNTKLEAARHGRKYGYSFQKALQNISGKRSAGLDRVPPIKGL